MEHLPSLSQMFEASGLASQYYWEWSPGWSFVAVEDGKVIGFVTAWVVNQPYAWVDNLLVHPEHRDKNVAYELCKVMHEELLYNGVSVIQVAIENPDLARVLKRVGFKSRGSRELLVGYLDGIRTKQDKLPGE